MSNRYRRRPAEIEAVQWTDTNPAELEAFAGQRFMTVDPEDRIDDPEATASLRESAHECWSLLRPGDWVVKRGEDFAVLSPEEFAGMYERAAAGVAPAADQTECPHCPDGHTPPDRGSQPWSAWVAAIRDGDGQPMQIIVARSAGAHVAESDAQWVRERLNARAESSVDALPLDHPARRECRCSEAGVCRRCTEIAAKRAAPPAAVPAVDQPPLRTAIAEALAREDAHNWGYDHGFVHVYGGDPETDAFVDAILAVLPDTSRAATWLDAAAECNKAGGAYAERGANDAAGAAFALMEAFLRKAGEVEYGATPCSGPPCEDGGEPCDAHERLMGHIEGDHELCAPDCGDAWMRRLADEAQRQESDGFEYGCPNCSQPITVGRRAEHVCDQAQQQADTETPEWARPETEEEKLAKARRMAKALSAPPVAPPEWATTTEWPNRHKRPRDRRVHATAPFETGTARQFWTACGKRIGASGYPLSHMPVDCRDCKQAIAAAGQESAAADTGEEA
ncbi:MAG: hypothetical protein HOV66_28700 [Streptomycetaceae bacterium]|nr:hypothetical protein [Streptomycetaceae bacterium]